MGKRVSLAEELKPFMVFARAMGVAPYTIANNIYEISPWAFTYTILLNIVNFIVILVWIDGSECSFPKIIIRALALIAAIFNTFYAFLHRRQTGELFKDVNKFDVSINLRPATKKHFATIWAYLLLATVAGGLVETVRVYNTAESTIFALNNIVIFVRFNASIGFFLSMLCSMLTRFQEMDRMIERDSNDLDMSDVVSRKSVGLRKIWILYDQLIEATEKLNSMYSAELLIWISMASCSAMMRIHTVRHQSEFTLIDIFGSSTSIIVIVLRLLLLTWYCHTTASMANEVAAKAFRINSRVSQLNRSGENEDTFVMGQYFVVRGSFQITAGGGLLRINLPLLRTIIATVVTYLVILRAPEEKHQGA